MNLEPHGHNRIGTDQIKQLPYCGSFARRSTPQKFKIALENGWLEDYLSFGMVAFQGLC